MFKKFLIAAFFIYAHSASSQMVEATGQAIIYNEDIADARYRATEQALKQAVLQANARVISEETFSNGEFESASTIRGAGRTQSTNIVKEVRKNDILTVVVAAEVTPEHICSNGATNLYRKSVGVTSFALQTPQQANLGSIHNIPRLMPRDLVREINKQGFLHALAATNIQLYPDLINAPTSTNPDGSLTDVARIGEDLGVQYVVTGVIRDIGPVNQLEPNKANVFKNFKHEENKTSGPRNLAIDIYLYDGFSGALLFEQSYFETGEWNLDKSIRTGYGSPRFKSTNFGKIAQQVLWQAALDTSSRLRCQPFMANIFRTEGNRVHINAGSIAGIKLNDTFGVYRRYQVFNQLQNPLTQLNNANINITIKQVQPNFSIGELNIDARILNVQQQDVVIAW